MTKAEILKGKFNTLARLFDAETGTKTGVRCRGKYSGTTDYSVTFNNGLSFYISNGMQNFEKNLDEYITLYSNFATLKPLIMEILKRAEALDNSIATEKGYNCYKILDVNYSKNGNYKGWFYVDIEVNGKNIQFTETGFNYAIENTCKSNDLHSLEENFSKAYEHKFFIAGGEKGVDMVFHNVGHNSNTHIYTINR